MIKIVEEFKTHIMEAGKSASNLGYDMVGIYSLIHIKNTQNSFICDDIITKLLHIAYYFKNINTC